jgi:hypothetical protein
MSEQYRKAFGDLEKYINSKDRHYQGGLRDAIRTIKIINDIPIDSEGNNGDAAGAAEHEGK